MELIARHKNANEYKVDRTHGRLEIAGDIHNVLPFDGGDIYVPGHYRADVNPAGVYRLRTGEMGIEIHRLTGEVRVCPVRGAWGAYYSIAPNVPTPLSYRQVHDGLLELFVNTPKVRYSFFISRHGFKVNIRLKEHTGDTFSHSFNVDMKGLTRQGRKIYHLGMEIGRLPSPFMSDSGGDGAIYPVQESISGGQVTLTATGLSNRTYPVDIDPTLTPLVSSADTYLRQAQPITNYGSSNELLVRQNPSGNRNGGALVRMDFTALPPDVTITLATVELYYQSLGGAPNRPIALKRLIQTGWVELQATHTIYKTGSNWASAGGDYTENDKDIVVMPASTTGEYLTWNPTAMFQYFQANDGEIANMIFLLDDALDINEAARFFSRDNATLNPRGSIDYALPGQEGGLMGGGFWGQKTLMGGGIENDW